MVNPVIELYKDIDKDIVYEVKITAFYKGEIVSRREPFYMNAGDTLQIKANGVQFEPVMK